MPVSTPTDSAGVPKFPGWRVVAGCFIALSVTSGLGFYGLAVYLNALSNERGWDVSSLSLATTWFFVVSGVAGVWVARLISTIDVRIVVAAGAVLGSVSLLALGHVDQQWQLFCVYGVFGLGFAAAGLVPMTTVVTRWFHEKRSVALSVASTGLSAGGILVTPAAKWLLDERGLAGGAPWLAATFVVGVLPVTLLLIRPDPLAAGWLPDGGRAAVDVTPPPPTGTPFQRAIRTRFFVLVTVGYLLTLGAQVGAIQQLVKLVEERTDASTAAFATLALAATSVVARLAGGQLVGRLAMTPFTAAMGVLQMIAMVSLGLSHQTLPIFVSIVLFGATVGNILMMQPLLLAERFGVLDYPKIYSRSQLIAMIGTAGGPLLLGWIHDVAGGYGPAYVVAGVCSLVGGVLIFGAGSETDTHDHAGHQWEVAPS